MSPYLAPVWLLGGETKDGRGLWRGNIPNRRGEPGCLGRFDYFCFCLSLSKEQDVLRAVLQEWRTGYRLHLPRGIASGGVTVTKSLLKLRQDPPSPEQSSIFCLEKGVRVGSYSWQLGREPLQIHIQSLGKLTCIFFGIFSPPPIPPPPLAAQADHDLTILLPLLPQSGVSWIYHHPWYKDTNVSE